METLDRKWSVGWGSGAEDWCRQPLAAHSVVINDHPTGSKSGSWRKKKETSLELWGQMVQLKEVHLGNGEDSVVCIFFFLISWKIGKGCLDELWSTRGKVKYVKMISNHGGWMRRLCARKQQLYIYINVPLHTSLSPVIQKRTNWLEEQTKHPIFALLFTEHLWLLSICMQ